MALEANSLESAAPDSRPWAPFRAPSGASSRMGSPPSGDSRREFPYFLRDAWADRLWSLRGDPAPPWPADSLEGGRGALTKPARNGMVAQEIGVGARTFRLSQRIRRLQNSRMAVILRSNLPGRRRAPH